MAVIYIYENKINGKCYVGQALDFNRRHKSHMRSDQYIDRALKKYGEDNFNVILIECDECLLNYLEEFYISWMQSMKPNGYNLTAGGEGSKGRKLSQSSKDLMKDRWTPERRAKQAIALKERHKTMWTPEKRQAQKDRASEWNRNYWTKERREQNKQKIKDAWTDERRLAQSKRTKDNEKYCRKCILVETNQHFISCERASEYMRNNGWPKAMGRHISACCKGKVKQAYDYHWVYEEPKNDEPHFEDIDINIGGHKKMCKLIEENLIFNSIREASKWLLENKNIKADTSYIGACCKGKYNKAYGYHWCFVEKYNET